MFGNINYFTYICIMKNYTKEQEALIIKTCNESESMFKASAILKLNYKTLIYHAKRLGCYKPNQSGKGVNKKPNLLYPLQDIFDGKHPGYSTSSLRTRLIKEGIKDHKCEICKGDYWLLRPIPLELHHKDGNKYNNCLDNLQLLCPNCHAFTDNYRSKNKIKFGE